MTDDRLYFQIYESTDENDLDLASAVFCVGTRMDEEEEDEVIVSAHTVEWGQQERDRWRLEMQM